MKKCVGQQLGSVALRYRRAAAAGSIPRAAQRRPASGGRLLWSGGRSPQIVTAAAGQTARRNRLEAILFLASEPLSLRKLAQSANLTDATEARTLLGQLRRRYDERGSAFQVEQVAGGYQLLTRPKFAPWLRPLAPTEREIRLSAPALETLAVVAYRQPVLRAEVEAIRGVACGEILRLLMDRDLLRIVGRSEELGRPLRYGTTKRFLEAFGLCNLNQMPLWSQLVRTVPAGTPEEALAESTSLPSELKPDSAGGVGDA
jgi:segregation and condensation protein B